MSVLIGHASISESGTINGSKGDSTGKEVCTRTWYSKPWDFMAIHTDANVREKHAKAVEQACANDNIGYGQSDRNTLNTQAKAVSYDLSKVGKCNCDCSSLQNVAAVASGASGVTYGSNGWTTSTMKAALQAAGYKIITDKAYLTSADYCVRGAIYVKASSHTVCGLTNGAKAAQTLAKAGVTGNASGVTSSGNTSYSGKGVGTAVAKGTMNIRSGAGTTSSSYGTISKGTAVEVLEILSNGWYKIVWPGASCGYAYTSNKNGVYYTYTAKATAAASKNSAKPAAAKYADNSVKGTYKTTANLNMRTDAGKGNTIICTIPKGKTVQCYKYYNVASDGSKWLYVQYGDYTGYCHIGYLQKV